MKSLEKLTSIIESIIFVSGTQVAISDIAEKLKSYGIPLKNGILTAEELEEDLCKLFQKV